MFSSRHICKHSNFFKQISQPSGVKRTSPNAVKSSGTRSTQRPNVSKTATNKRTASASQATTESSEEASRRAASKPKRNAACVSSPERPQISNDASATKPDMLGTLERPTRIRVVPPKKTNPFQIPQARGPKVATRKTLKDFNTPELDKVVKLEPQTFTFVRNGSRAEQKGYVRPDTPPKSTELAARKTYSEATSGPDRKSADAATKADVGPHAALKDKTNKSKAPPKVEPKAPTETSTHSESTKSAVKQKMMAADGKVIAMESKPATAKRPRSSDETHANDRPTKKLATKQTPVLDAAVRRQPPGKADEGTLLNLLSSPTEAEKTPVRSSTSDVDTKLDSARTEEAPTAPVTIIEPRKLKQDEAAPNSDPSNPSVEGASKSTVAAKPDVAAVNSDEVAAQEHKASPDVNLEADAGNVTYASVALEPTSACDKDTSAKQDRKISKTSHHTPRSTPDRSEESEQRKRVATVVKKAPKRAWDRADNIINDYSDEEDVKPKRKAKKPKCSLEESDEGSTPKSQVARTSRDNATSPTKDAKSRSSEGSAKKYKKDMSLAEENVGAGWLLDGPRQRRTPLSAPSTPSTPSSPPRHTGFLKQTAASTWATMSESSDASASTSAAGAKRKHADSDKKPQSSNKQKATRRDKVVAAAVVSLLHYFVISSRH